LAIVTSAHPRRKHGDHW